MAQIHCYNNARRWILLFAPFHFRLLSILSLFFSSTILIPSSECEILRGTTKLNWPYVNRQANGQYEGFCIDLLNELAPLMGMAYTLEPVPDGEYGGWLSPNGSLNGMIGQVSRGEVDFAIGDLTVLSTRARHVDFTQSFMDYGLSALIRKDSLTKHSNLRTFKDLSEQTEMRYGVKKHRANLPLFHNSPTIAKMYSFMDTHPSVFVSGEREGVTRVKNDPNYAFIAESPFVEYVVQRDCQLGAIDDRRKHFQFEYAIAVPLGSPLKIRFDKALRILKRSGKIRELREKYWRSDRCSPGRRADSERNENEAAHEPDSELINFENEKIRNLSNQNSNDNQNDDHLPKPSGEYRMRHDEVDDTDFEIIKPRPEDRRRNPIRPAKRPSPNSIPSTLLSSSVGINTGLVLITVLLYLFA